jgi:hypothetical protein
VVGHDHPDGALLEAAPELFAIVRLADGRRTLEMRRSFRNLLGGEREIMQTGLGGEAHPFGLRGANHRDG